jgi:aspartate/methionine/tyrosine aminotransferase
VARVLTSTKAVRFTESVIREMTRLALKNGAVNLSQGFPDFPAPPELKRAAVEAIQGDVNQYAITWGAKPLRDAIARKVKRYNGIDADPEKNITVTCGATEGMICAFMGLINPGDEVVIFEPYYENYGPDAILSGATPRFVKLRPPGWGFDEKELAKAFNKRTKAVVVTTPNNPTGKVFTRAELEAIAALCRKWDAVAITDEVYEHILFEGEHVSMASLPGMAGRTVTVTSLSKTFSVTGWRLGYVVAPDRISAAVRKVHDFLTVGAPHPLQAAAAAFMDAPNGLFEALSKEYLERRETLYPVLEETGFRPLGRPAGAYYVMCDISGFGFPNDVAFARWLVEEGKVAVVPGSSFFRDPVDGRRLVRFAFCKTLDTLRAAAQKLRSLPPSPALRRGLRR